MKTTLQKLDSVIATLTILLPRLTEPYYSDVKHCIAYNKEIRADIDSGLLYERTDADRAAQEDA